jgi:hypothetical protein
MKFPTWIKPALFGAVAGAIALAIFGFSYGGWVTGGGAADLAKKQSQLAVVEALMPYCIDRSTSDPVAVTVLAELKDASSFQRRSILEKSGWATALGTDAPNAALAQACQLKLAEAAL